MSEPQKTTEVIVVEDDKRAPVPTSAGPHPRAYLSRWFQDAKKLGMQRVLTEVFFEMFVRTAIVEKNQDIWHNFLQ